SDNATTCGLARARLPKNSPCVRVHSVDLASLIRREHQPTGCRRHAGEHRMRRVILPADTTSLRVERREPPLRLLNRIEYVGEWGFGAEPQSTGRRLVEVSLELDVRAPVHSGHEQRIALRAERG